MEGGGGQSSAIWLGTGAHLTARDCQLSAPHGAVRELTGQAHAEVSDSPFLIGVGSRPVVRVADESLVNLSRGRQRALGAGGVVSAAVHGRRGELTARACTFSSARRGLSARGASRVTLAECLATERARVLPGGAWTDVRDRGGGACRWRAAASRW